MNTFDRDKHEYRIGESPVPSVTQIIPKPDFYCTPEQLEAARVEGEENHSMIKMFFDTGAGSDPMIISLIDWLEENKNMTGDIVLYEKALFSKKHSFAGKPDAIFSKAIIDFKRSYGNKKLHALQIAGYHSLAIENRIISKSKVWLILVYNGKKFTAKNVYDPQAESIFISLVKKYYIERGLEIWMSRN
jgi:hypothetical protein